VKISQATRNRVEHRLRHWFDLAMPEHIAKGSVWYTEARAFALEVSVWYKIPMPVVCGVIAALSPSVFWELNMVQARTLCRAHAEGGDLESVVVSTYGKQAEKARDILTCGHTNPGKVEDILCRNVAGRRRAFKTLAFFRNILDAGSLAVTVDQHIVAAAGFEEEFTQSAAWCYDLLADAIRDIAAPTGYRPYQVQAIIWTVYKATVGRRAPVVNEPAPF